MDSCEIGISSGTGDSGESIDAEAGVESDTSFPTVGLRMTAGLRTAGLRAPVTSEHPCSAARMRTCSISDSNQSLSLISLDLSIGSSLWKPPHLKNCLDRGMFDLPDNPAWAGSV